MKDKCGVTIETGCVVDILADGMLSAFVVEVREGGLAGPGGQIEPALLVLNIAIPMKLTPGEPAPVYIVRASDKPKAEKKVSVM